LGDPETIETEYGAQMVTFQTDGENLSIAWTENDGSSISGNDLVTVNVTLQYDSGTDEQIEIQTPVFTSPAGTDYFGGVGGFDVDDSNNDDKRWATKYGSIVEYDDENEDELTIIHPDDWVSGEVYVAPTEAALSTVEGSAEGCQISETLNPIPSTVNKFDTEVMSAYQTTDVVSIGGPCANSLSSTLLGNPEVCWEGFEEGKAMLKLVESGDNVALIVAGGTGKDTQLVSTILQNYEDYDLSGTEMEAITVSESSLSVGPVTTTTTEDITFSASSDDAELNFVNTDGKDVTIPMVFNDSSTQQL
jgi:hypothetical protein